MSQTKTMIGKDPKAQNFLRAIYDLTYAQIDIVAVHGLNPTNADFHAEQTWTASNEKMWLKDFLPTALPMARIFLFGYNANVAFETSIAGIQEQAENLLNRLALKRSARTNSAERPLIFVCHSLGGLVVKRALVTAKQTNKYSNIKNSTYGIVFFGTPHRGGNHVLLGNIAASIARMALRNPTNTFMEALKKDSLFADQLVRDFKQQLEDYYILSFFETQPYNKTMGLIVDRQSATLGLSLDRETQVPLAGNHEDICKFESGESDVYEQVQGNIVELADNAIKAMEERARLAALGAPSVEQLSLIPVENHNGDSEKILNWLSTTKYNSRHEESISKFQDGTGQWLLKSQEYQHWLQNDGETLFCHGIPGAGKTILTSAVVKELHSCHDTSIGTAYFYFTYDQQHHEQKPLEIFKCLLRQLCEKLAPMPAAVITRAQIEGLEIASDYNNQL